jgi:hypothetical protein
MNVTEVVLQLRYERSRLDAAIQALEGVGGVPAVKLFSAQIEIGGVCDVRGTGANGPPSRVIDHLIHRGRTRNEVFDIIIPLRTWKTSEEPTPPCR